jgi:sarcosine oxidase
VLTGAALTARFPAFQFPPETLALFQPDGGFLVPEACVLGHLTLARQRGAEVHENEPVLDWRENSDGVEVRTVRETYFAKQLIITAGAWVGKLVPQMTALAKPERQVVIWMRPLHPELFTPENFPVTNLGVEEGHLYGFPEHNVPGFKFGRYHHRHELVDPDTMQHDADPEDERMLRSYAVKYFPAGAGPTLAMQTCMFTNTSDGHFILDFLPGSRRVIIGSPCSGHGFKFAGVVGEILADLVQHGDTAHDITMHRLGRFPVVNQANKLPH